MGEGIEELASEPRRWSRIVGIVLIAIALLAGFYLTVAYFAWENGQALRQEQQQTEAEAQIERQVNLARENMAQGSYALAQTRLAWVLERVPNHAEAQALQQEAEANLAALLTPMLITAVSEPTATPTPEPSPTPGAITDATVELARIERLTNTQQWEAAISTLIIFQSQFPDYERMTTDRMLYDAYVAYGLQLVQGKQVELGLYYFDQAQKLGDLPQEAIDYRTWAELYTQGVAFYAVNWGAASFYFRDLCLAAPFYQNACQLFYESLVAYADLYAVAQDWCPAEELYREALGQQRSTELRDKLTEAQEGCLLATPTPEAGGITNTLTITTSTGTEP
ncbi:MAG: hypothetical protein KDE56_16060 [Anaerolineales bacterium]|nr:hypothetical protein [Anaerolineales bacterium]